MAFKTVIVIFMVCAWVQSRLYQRCELVRDLYLSGVPGDQLATWVCIAKYESNFNTSALNYDSGDHGIFQISQLYWCKPYGPGGGCHASCSQFKDDDIRDDIACAQHIFQEHEKIQGNGFLAWTVYPRYCSGNVYHYLEGC